VQVLVGTRRSGVVANLYNGSWWTEISKKHNSLPPTVGPLIRGLLQQLFDRGQIIDRPKRLPKCPRTDSEWLDEAVASHAGEELFAIVTRKSSGDARTGMPNCVMALEEILLNPDWNSRKTSRRFPRTTSELEQALRPLLATARSIQLIDAQLGFRTYRG